MNKIIVTGGSGFIGTNVVENLTKNGYVILNLDHNSPINQTQLSTWREVDLLDLPLLTSIILEFQPDAIIHLGAVTDLNGVDLTYYDANITGVRNLISIADQLPNLKKVIFASSMYVCKPGFIPNDYDTYRPHTVYGESKVQTELIIKENLNTHYEWIIVRPTSIWGPWFNIPYIDFFKIVYQRKYFDFGNTCTKSYGFIGNTVFQIKSLLETKGLHSRVFYLGDLPATPISEWANEISLKMNKGSIKKIPFFIIKIAAFFGDFLKVLGFNFPITSFRLKNMTTNNVLPLDDIYNVTGKPPYSRQDGTAQTLAWLKNHKGYQF